jgi:hypothetical protein
MATIMASDTPVSFTTNSNFDGVIPELTQDLAMSSSLAPGKLDKQIEAEAAANVQKKKSEVPAHGKIAPPDYSLSENKAFDALTARTERMLTKDLTFHPVTSPSKEEEVAAANANKQKAKVNHDQLKVEAAKELVKDQKNKVKKVQQKLKELGVPINKAVKAAKKKAPKKAVKKKASKKAGAAKAAKKILKTHLKTIHKARKLEKASSTSPEACKTACSAKSSHWLDCKNRCLHTDVSCINWCRYPSKKCLCECDKQNNWECDGDNCHCLQFRGELSGPVEDAMIKAENAALAQGKSEQEAKADALAAEKAAEEMPAVPHGTALD